MPRHEVKIQSSHTQFTLSEAEVLAALLYYEENRDAIEAQEAAYQRALDKAHRNG